MAESLNILRIDTRSQRGRVGFARDESVIDWVLLDDLDAYVAEARRDPERWRVVALADALRARGIAWRDVLDRADLQQRIAAATAEPPKGAKVVMA